MKTSAFVKLDKFNDSSIDILIYCFTSTNDWDRFLEIKENLAMEVKQKVEDLNLNLLSLANLFILKKIKFEFNDQFYC